MNMKDGDWGWLNNVVLASKLEQLNIESYISDLPIDKFDVGNNNIIFLHGKDSDTQFKGMPLTLNDRTINWVNDFIYDSGLEFKDNLYVVKGDLHQYAITESRRFQYISCPSLYGSSNYIAANFGKTKWGVGFMEVFNDHVTTGVIKE